MEKSERKFHRMVKDMDFSQMPQNSYFHAETARILEVGGKAISFTDMDGNSLCFDMTNPGYRPIGVVGQGNTLIVFSSKEVGATDGNGEIGIATYDFTTNQAVYVPIYNHPDLRFNPAHQIEAIYYPETQNIKRSYWCDWYNSLRSINTADPIFTTYIASGSLVVGQQYMVVQGEIDHAAVLYGPNNATTVFTATGTTYTVTSGPALVIKYYNVALIDAVPSKDTGNIYLKSLKSGGQCKGGEYSFAYQLYTTDGTETNWSYLSQQVQVPDSNMPNTSRSRGYQEMQGEQSANNTNKAIEITIEGIDTVFDKIRIAAVRSTTDVAADPPIIFFDGAISGTSMTVTFFGNENLGSILFDDLIAPTIAFKRVGTLASVKRRLYIGRTEIFEDPIYDPSVASVVPIQYLMPSDIEGRKNVSDSGFADYTQGGIFGHWCSASSGVASGNILTDQWYIVESGSISYGPGPTVYNAGDVFQGVNTYHTFTVSSGSPVVYAIIRIKQYGTIPANTVYKNIKILDDYSDYKGSAACYYLQSLMRGETYRWGMVLYDFLGNPMFVHWIKDKKMPEIYDTTDPETGNPLGFSAALAFDNFSDYGTGVSGNNITGTTIRALGLEFSGIDFQEIADNIGCSLAELPNFISGFSIVRAKRDPVTVAQGLLYPTSPQTGSPNRVKPSMGNYPSLHDDAWVIAGRRQLNTYAFHSPDTLFKSYQFSNEDYIQIVDYLTEQFAELSQEGTLHTNNYHYYLKHYTSDLAPPIGRWPAKGTTNGLKITDCAHFSAGANDIAFGTLGLVWNAFNILQAGSHIDLSNNRKAVAGATTILTTTTAEPGGSNSFAAYGSTTKTLINLKKNKQNLYGGTSDSSKANTVYIFCGHYQSLDAAFMSYVIGNSGIADGIQVFGGDTFVGLFDYGRLLKDETDTSEQFSQSVVFPCESTINFLRREGRHFARHRHYESGNPNPNGLSYPNQPEQYIYNTAYSYEEGNVTFQGLPINYVKSGLYDKRVHVSEGKIDGEKIDNFKKFLVNNYRDLDALGGYLTNLRSKQDRLWYWQHHIFGWIPAEERTQISGNLGDQITLGTGGILERYDQIDSFYGNQHQFGLAEMEDGFAWIDFKKKTMCTAIGGKIDRISTTEGLSAFFSGIQHAIINSDNPILDAGITACYNHRFKELVFVFRGIPQFGVNYEKGFMLTYSLAIKGFQSISNILPGLIYSWHDNYLSMSLFIPGPIQPTLNYAEGDRVLEGQDVYICITPFTAPFIPVNPSADPVHWAPVYKIGSVFVENVGAVAKFFGWCRNSKITIVEPTSNPFANKVFLNAELHGGENFFERFVYANENGQAASETLNDNYQYNDRSWYWTIPLSTRGDRFVDHFILIQGEKTNHVPGQIHISRNERVKLISLSTEYYQAK